MLAGELGGGKTQFVKGLAEGLGITDYITSPTFNYENIYQGPSLALYHFDLYRENELDPDIEMILAEALADKKGVVAVEWSERTRKWPKKFTKFDFEWKGENERQINITE